MRFLIILGIILFQLVFPAAAQDDGAVEKASVRMFHEVCIGNITNPARVATLLSQFEQFPKDAADKFRTSMDASPDSEVWAMGFKQASFVSIIDPDQKKCDVVSDSKLDFIQVEKEFREAAKGFAVAEGSEMSALSVEKSDLMSSVMMAYTIPSLDLKLDIFASVKNGAVLPGQLGSIYTMRIMDTASSK